MKTDRVFVLLLVVLLPLSGCFDGSVGDADAANDVEENADTTVTQVVNNYYNQSTNELPIFYVNPYGYGDIDRVSTFNSSTGNEETRMYFQKIQLWFSVSDIDGNITQVGFDMDMDYVIDHSYSNNSTWNNLSYYQTPGIAQTNGTLANYGNGEYSSTPSFCFAKINLIAIDNDGGQTIIPYVIRIDSNLEQGYGCKEDYTGYEE